MRLLPALICIILYASFVSANGMRVKRGLSANEQKKLVDELNKDRQEIGKKVNLSFKKVTYDVSLENSIGSMDCQGARPSSALSGNSVLLEHMKIAESMPDAELPFFDPNFDRIGCSKSFKCSVTLGKQDKAPHLVGKTMEVHGLCVFSGGDRTSNPIKEKRKGVQIPSAAKYGKILGVAEPSDSSGRAFNLIISLFW